MHLLMSLMQKSLIGNKDEYFPRRLVQNKSSNGGEKNKSSMFKVIEQLYEVENVMSVK